MKELKGGWVYVGMTVNMAHKSGANTKHNGRSLLRKRASRPPEDALCHHLTALMVFPSHGETFYVFLWLNFSPGRR